MEDVLRQRAAFQGPMPALFPVVLYSGVRRWTAPLQLRALIDAVPATLETVFPGFPDRVFAHWYSGTIRLPQSRRLGN